MGRHQRGGRKPLRVRLAAELPHANASAGLDRDHLADPLRELPRQAAARLEGKQHPALGQPTHQPLGRSRAQQELAADDHEWVLISRFSASLWALSMDG